ALRPVWRSDQALQLGLDPDRAVVVDGIDEPIAKALLGLDGTRTEAEVLAGAAETGLDPDLVGELLTDLLSAGVLAQVTPRPPSVPAPTYDSPVGSASARPALLGAEPARAPAVAAPGGPDPVGDGPVVMASWPRTSPYGAVGAAGRLGPDLASLSLVPTTRTPFEVVRARRAASVVVHGAGRVGASLATLLAAAGVGQVHVADRGPVRPGDVAPAGVAAADVDRSRTAAAAEALRRAAPEIRSTPPAPGRRPDLVVLASTEPVDTTLRTALAGGRVAHLVAGVRETTAVVGPLVLP